MNPREIRTAAAAFQQSRILLSAYELGIFTFIDSRKFSSGDVANGLNLDASATERLLNALVALEFLQKSNGQYSNTADSERFLSKKSDAYLAGLMHTNLLWNTWNHLTDVVKTGKSAHDVAINEREPEWLEAFIHAMHDRGKKQAPSQISKIDLQHVKSLLDVGGGSGCFSMAFLQRKPTLKAAIFDLPNVVPISQKIIEREGFSGQIKHFTGDYTRDQLPTGFDLIFLSAVIHSNPPETNQNLVKKCYHSLMPEGRIVIQDWIMNEARTSPLEGAIFSINMLVGVESGDCYSEKEVTDWLSRTGFTDIRKEELDAGKAQIIGTRK